MLIEQSQDAAARRDHIDGLDTRMSALSVRIVLIDGAPRCIAGFVPR